MVFCDAFNEEAVANLRQRKIREDKPFAVMATNLDIVKKICEVNDKEMVKALPGINPSSITKNGAVGTFDLKKGDIKKIFDFIGKVPTDMDMPEIGVQYNNSAVFKEENNVENEPKENDILTDSKNEALFNEADANSLASDRKLGEVKNAFYKLKEFIKSKNISKQKGEEKE